MKTEIIRCYSELVQIPTFIGRYQYLKLSSSIGVCTFGFDRYLNQMFYSNDPDWSELRDKIMIRDNGFDLAMDGYPIQKRPMVHHMNPITVDDIRNRTAYLLDPEYLILTQLSTHNAIHYGDESLLPRPLMERRLNDTCPWRH